MTNKSYLLPAVIDPGTSRCIRVYVPDDPLYIAAFFGSLEYLTTWLAWQRDTAKRGKDAAAVWKPYFEQTRTEWELALGECGVVDVRVSPTDDCVLEKTVDGLVWTPFANILDCLKTLPPAAYPDPPPGETKPEASADDLIYFFKWLIAEINARIKKGDDRVDTKFWIMSMMVTVWPGTVHYGASEVLLDALEAHTQQERNDAVSDPLWEDLYQAVGCEADADGSYDDAAGQTLQDWFRDAGKWIFDALHELTVLLYVSYPALQRMIMTANGGPGAGFDELLCPWAHTFDFTPGLFLGWFTEQIPFFIPDLGGTIGVGGWASDRLELSVPGGTFSEQASIRNAFGPTRITRIEVTTIIPAEAFIETHIFEPAYGGGQSPITILALSGASGTVVLEWTGSQIMTSVGVSSISGNGGTDSGVGNTIEKVVIEGIGPNPFE